MFRHAITLLPIPTQGLVNDAIYRALRVFAEDGNHGISEWPNRISIQHIYLSAADILATGPLRLERPNREDRFTSLAYGRNALPSEFFPDYGISDAMASLMRLTIWDAFLHGILAPAPTSRPIFDRGNIETENRVGGGQFFDLDYVMLTPYGVDVLLQLHPHDRIRVYDPSGYIANFNEPGTDPEMMAYVAEGIIVLQGNHLLASVVLIGIASERLVEVTALAIRDAQGNRGEVW